MTIIFYMYKKIIFNYLFFLIFIFMFCIFHQSSYCNINTFMRTENTHQRSISQIFCYQLCGNIIYMVNTQKIFGRFIWTQCNKNSYNIKLFDVFGFALISIYVENGIVSISSNIMRQNKFLKDEIQQWFVVNQYSVKQLQQWIIGSPGYNTEYNLNSIGCLSYVHYHCNNESIFIYYRSYYVSNNPILPKILDIYYGKHYVKLIINRWDIQ